MNTRKERMEDILFDNSKLAIKGLTDCGTMAWGSVIGCNVYVRYFKVEELAVAGIPNLRPTLISVVNDLIGKDANDATTVYAICKNVIGETLIYLYKLGDLIQNGVPLETDMTCNTFQLVGCSYFRTKEEDVTKQELDLYWKSHVPFVDGANNSRRPVLWYVPGVLGKGYNCQINFSDSEITDNLHDKAADLARTIEAKLPPVTLPDEKDRRYGEVLINGNVKFMYNRNHLGYNGNITDVRRLAAILLRVFFMQYSNIVSETLVSVINGSIIEPTLSVNQESVQMQETPEEKPKYTIGAIGHGKISGCANALLNAARKSNPGYTGEV